MRLKDKAARLQQRGTLGERAGAVRSGGALQHVGRHQSVQQPRHPQHTSVQLHAPLLRGERMEEILRTFSDRRPTVHSNPTKGCL